MRRKKKRPELNTDKTKGDTFFPSVQKKLAIGKARDSYEVEADKMADTVVNSNDNQSIQKKEATEDEIQKKPLASSISKLQKKEMAVEDEPVQRMGKEEEQEPVQKKEEEEKPLQKKAAINNQQESTTTEQKLKEQKGNGQTMDSETMIEMEQGFGINFSNVNIHTDSKAEKLSNQLGAQAFTHGNDIYFNKGKYNPNSKEGKHLLAHELTHTIQQGNSKTVQKKDKEGKPTTCEGKEDISNLMTNFQERALAAIDSSSLSDDEKGAKKQIVNIVLQDEGLFSIGATKFYACDTINLPALGGASDNGFSGYSNSDTNEIGGLKSFKSNIEKVIHQGDLSALLIILKLIGHEKRHLNISGAPVIENTDIRNGNTEANPIALSSYLVEEILVNAEEIAINHRYENGNYSVPLSLSAEIRRYWLKIESIVTLNKSVELKEFITTELETRYSSKDRSNAISRGILNAMERGNWNHNP